jgi:predicted nucleic acid-binding protein
VIVVLDACVVVKLFIQEENHADALFFNSSVFTRIAPEILLVEVANAFRKKIFNKEMDINQAEESLNKLPKLFDELFIVKELIEKAFNYAVELNHPVGDCVYLALAIKNDAKLITSDAKFLSKVQKTSMKNNIHLLSDPTSSFNSGYNN